MAEKNQNHDYANLNQWSTEALNELLRADIESPESGDDGVIFHILEVIEAREKERPTGRLSDVSAAWADFQTHYNTPEGEGLSLYPGARAPQADLPHPTPIQARQNRPHRRLVKGLIATAAVIAVLFASMVAAQAGGIDVFGALARWSDETFHFAPGGDARISPGNAALRDALQTALDTCGLPAGLVPTWYPEGFEGEEPKISTTDMGDKIHCSFSDEAGDSFRIQVWKYNNASDLSARIFEKDDTAVEPYTSNQRTFYILSNENTVTATWSDGRLMIAISGNLSVEEIKAMIDSIGGYSI